MNTPKDIITCEASNDGDIDDVRKDVLRVLTQAGFVIIDRRDIVKGIELAIAVDTREQVKALGHRAKK